jgi:hypothetical protein
MENFIFLVATLILTLMVFGVDASKKRRQYLNEQES